jgi:circadian clock protein KaiC
VELDADELAQSLLETLRSRRARRLVVDPLFELERSLGETGRRRDFMAGLRAALEGERVTALFTAEVARAAGVEVDSAQSPASVFAENIICLSTQEVRSRMLRQLQVLKMRASAHSWEVRGYQISGRGVSLLTPESRPGPNGDAAGIENPS